MNRIWALFLLLQYCCSFGNDSLAEAAGRNLPFLAPQNLHTKNILQELRGGAKKKGKSRKRKQRTSTGGLKVQGSKKDANEDKGLVSEAMKKYKGVLPVSRVYLTGVVIATLMGHTLGEELTQEILALDRTRVMYGFELWRPFTAALFLGPVSIGWLMNAYYLVQYGTSLETAYGAAQFLTFLLSQIVVLSLVSSLLGQPFYANSMITAMLHVLSRAMPKQKVKWLVITIPYWFLPYGLMITDALQAQNAMAVVPHVIGLLSGHFYHFHKFIWPKVGGEDWLVAPDFFISRMEGDNSIKSKEKIADALKKTRKRGKGRKLGSGKK